MVIEKTVRDYLVSKNITGIGGNVYLDLPADMTNMTEYVVVQKTGSTGKQFMEAPVIAVQSYSKTTKYTAALINELVKGAMYELPNSVKNVFGCTLNTDYDFTNTATKEYRYQSVWQINYLR